MQERLTLENISITSDTLEDITRTFLGLRDESETSTFISPHNSNSSETISSDRIEGKDYTKIGPIKKLNLNSH